MRSLDEIYAHMDFLKKYGIEEIEFTGGEPTLHPDWFKIVEYAAKNFRHVATISNGWKFSSEDFIKDSKAAGLNEILFSLHGYDQETHSSITKKPLAFHRIVAAMHFAKMLNIMVRINTTVCSLNVNTLYQNIELIESINPIGINFLPVNYWSDNSQYREPTSYKEMSDCIKRCIDVLEGKIDFINVRYIPFCYMKGYEKYVSDWSQRQYDLWDWNNHVADHFLSEDEKEGIIKNGISKYSQVIKMRRYSYKKYDSCMECKYLPICDGIEKQLEDPVFPEDGDFITNPLYFRKDYCNINEYKGVLNEYSNSHRSKRIHR